MQLLNEAGDARKGYMGVQVRVLLWWMCSAELNLRGHGPDPDSGVR